MRRFWINTHLYLAAFFAPLLLLVAVSGGLYLIGDKGDVTKRVVAVPSGSTLNATAASFTEDVRSLLRAADQPADFEYLKGSGSKWVTRPTSREYFEINIGLKKVSVNHVTPNLQKRMMELHKGHGPTWFKTLQKALAVGLMIIVISGLWLGLSSTALRLPSIGATLAGLALALVLALYA